MLVRIVPLSVTRAPSFRGPKHATTGLTMSSRSVPAISPSATASSGRFAGSRSSGCAGSYSHGQGPSGGWYTSKMNDLADRVQAIPLGFAPRRAELDTSGAHRPPFCCDVGTRTGPLSARPLKAPHGIIVPELAANGQGNSAPRRTSSAASGSSGAESPARTGRPPSLRSGASGLGDRAARSRIGRRESSELRYPGSSVTSRPTQEGRWTG